MSGRRGFTLLEMLVASTIMGVAIVGLLGCITGATRNAAKLRDYDRVVLLARLRMNEILADELLPQGASMTGSFDPSLTGGMPVSWVAKLTTVESPPLRMVGQPSLERVELKLTWTTGSQEHSFSLDAFRTHPLRQGDL